MGEPIGEIKFVSHAPRLAADEAERKGLGASPKAVKTLYTGNGRLHLFR
jgi:hypothetical protein